MSTRPACLFLVASIAVLILGLASENARGVGIGDGAPSFSLTDIDGYSHSLMEYGSHPVLLMFLQYNDAAAISLAPQVQSDFQSRYLSQGLIVLGIETSGCSNQDLSNFRYQTGVDFPLLLNGGSVLAEYGVPQGSFVLIDASGVVKYIANGPGAGAYDKSAMQEAVDQALRDAATVKAMTWGLIKNIYK